MFFFFLILCNIKLTNKTFKTKFRREIKAKKRKNGKREKKGLHLVLFLRGLGPSSQEVTRKA